MDRAASCSRDPDRHKLFPNAQLFELFLDLRSKELVAHLMEYASPEFDN